MLYPLLYEDAMARHILFGIVALTLCWHAAVFSEESATLQSKPCQDVGLSEAAVDARITALKLKANELQTEYRGLIVDSEEKKDVERQATDVQEELLDLVFKRECFRRDLAVQVLRGPSGNLPAWMEVITYFATNRVATGDNAPETFFGFERRADPQDLLQYGKTVISIPTNRTPGDLNLPSLWKFEISPDPNKHFIFKRVIPLNSKLAQTELASAMAQNAKNSLLVFVHGYNVSFADAALRTAQMAHDLSFPGTAVFFSWPSAGETKKYLRDEETVRLSEKAFDRFLEDLGSLGASEIFVIAHSMGNRLVTEVLRDRVSRGKPIGSIRELLLAAPDINSDIFKENIVPALNTLSRLHRTIYASNSDVALRASAFVHDYRRVGETVGGVQIYSGFETIDASKTAPFLRAFGHSYVVDSIKVLGDMSEMFSFHFNADERHLDRGGTPPSVWWLLE